MRTVRFIDIAGDHPDRSTAAKWGYVEAEGVRPSEYAPWTKPSQPVVNAGALLSWDDILLDAPVQPNKIVCVGRNYVEHAAEFGNEAPSEPLIFLKPQTALIGPDQPVVYPGISERVDHEGELAVVIGYHCRHVSEDEAARAILGYTIANDVTARDLQRKDGQWTRGKGFDTFAPVGPWIDLDFDPRDKIIRCSVNGELRQESNTSLMIHSIERIISYVSAFMTLEPGDIIMTGTPAGVGPVSPGDVMTVEIEGLGELSNPVVSEELPS